MNVIKGLWPMGPVRMPSNKVVFFFLGDISLRDLRDPQKWWVWDGLGMWFLVETCFIREIDLS